MKTTIHINRHRVAQNRKNAEALPPISCRTYKGTIYGNDVAILDGQGNVVAHIKYSPEKPLSCGATVWIETAHDPIVAEI
jgi:hypothetical protein